MELPAELLEGLDLTTELARLAEARRSEVGAQRDLDQCQAALEATQKWQDLQRAKGIMLIRKSSVETQERLVRGLARQDYALNAIKRPAPGIEMKLKRTVVYTAAALFSWCLEHANLFLTLDTKAIGKVDNAATLARSGAPIGITETYEPYIATDLSGYLLAKPDENPDWQAYQAIKAEHQAQIDAARGGAA